MKEYLNGYTQNFLTSNDYHNNYKILKQAMGLDINARNDHNQTALMLAAQKGNIDLIKLYIDHGADINLYDNYGDTALSLAERNNHYNVIEFLKTKNANQKRQHNRIFFELEEKPDKTTSFVMSITLTKNLIYELLKIIGPVIIINILCAIIMRK